MMQPASPTSDRRVPPWVAILVLVVLIAIVVAGLWYFMGGGGSRTVVTDPAFEPGGVMTNEWLYSPNTSGIRRTDPKQPDQWRIKSGNTWVDVARVDGKLRFRINDRRGWGRGSSVMTREQGDVLRMAGQIAGNPSRFRYLNLTQQQVDTLKAQGGSVTSDLPADSTAALAEAWPKFEAASGRSKEQAEEQIVQIVSEIPPKQKQLVASRVDAIRRTLTPEQLALYERGPAPATTRAAPPRPPATIPATVPTTSPATVPATRPVP